MGERRRVCLLMEEAVLCTFNFFFSFFFFLIYSSFVYFVRSPSDRKGVVFLL